MIFTRRKTIGVFISKVFALFDNAVFSALYREGRRLNYDIVVFLTAGYFLTSTDYDVQEKNIFRLAALEKLDGVLFVPDSYEQGELRDLLFETVRSRVHCPKVALRHESQEFDCICTDDKKAIRPLIRHLIEDHGLRRICFQTGFPGHEESRLRQEAFLEEMAAHHLPVPEGSICPGNMWTSCGEQAYEAFFAHREEPPEAVVCANDYMAAGLIRTLRVHGLRVPEDVVVTGFDNAPNLGVDVPGLTTVEPAFDTMVTKAMELLDQRIRGDYTSPDPVRIPLGGKLILGESCGCGSLPADYELTAGQRLLAQVEAEDNHDRLMNNMCIDLSACDTLRELHQTLLSRRVENPIVRDHYLCLFGDETHLLQEDSPQACLVHAIRDHQDCGMPMITFPRVSLLPPMAERPEEPQLFFLKLLHQRGHNFGYSVFQYRPGSVPSRAMVPTNVMLSVALENIRHRQEMAQLFEELRRSSITDPLTSLLNRRGLSERLDPAWPALQERQIAFICMDLDHLKRINDTYGHPAGDLALRLVGRAIQEILPGDAAAARMGGDEFVAFLPRTESGEAEHFVRDFSQALRKLAAAENLPFPVTASAGFVLHRLAPLDTVDRCLQLSDREMYRIKEAHHASPARDTLH